MSYKACPPDPEAGSGHGRAVRRRRSHRGRQPTRAPARRRNTWPAMRARRRSPAATAPSGASLREHEGELVAAAAGNGVGLPQAVAEQRGHLAEHTAAARVTMFVVDILETVEVDDEHGQRPSGARRTRPTPCEAYQLVPARLRGRQIIGAGKSLGLLESAGVVECERSRFEHQTATRAGVRRAGGHPRSHPTVQTHERGHGTRTARERKRHRRRRRSMRHASVPAEIGRARNARSPQHPRAEGPDRRRLPGPSPRPASTTGAPPPADPPRPSTAQAARRGARGHHVGDAARVRSRAGRPHQLDDGGRATQTTDQKRRAALHARGEVRTTVRNRSVVGREW